ncbi:MAG TPA: hypothetical protein VJ939_09470 [Bacteroidales bacterium]|nr:hypothetical protein [Bacteroidales bacterium]
MKKKKNNDNIRLKGGSFFHPESLIIQESALIYFRGNIFSPLKYSVTIPLDKIKSIESTEGYRHIIIKSKNLTVTCRNFSRKKLQRLFNLIDSNYS